MVFTIWLKFAGEVPKGGEREQQQPEKHLRLSQHEGGEDEKHEEGDVRDHGHEPDHPVAAAVADHRDVQEPREQGRDPGPEEPERVHCELAEIREREQAMDQPEQDDQGGDDDVEGVHVSSKDLRRVSSRLS